MCRFLFFFLLGFVGLYSQTSLELQWTSLEENVGGTTIYRPIALSDKEGNVCVCSNTWFSNGADQAFYLVKYDSLGNKLWDANYTTGHTVEYVKVCEIDSEGNVILGGPQYSGFGTASWSLVKFDVQGEILWFYKKDPSSISSLGDITIDKEDKIYVIHTIHETNTDNEFLSTLKLDKEGNEVWQYDFDGGNFDHHPIKGKALEDKIMVFGGAGGYKILQLDLDGNLINVAGFGGIDLGDAIFDNQGNLLIGDEAKEYEVTKVSPLGDILWNYELPAKQEPFSSYARLRNLTVDEDDNVYVAGEHYTDSTLFDIVTTKFSPEGDTIWMDRFNYNKLTTEIPYDIHIDETFVYVTGWLQLDSTIGDLILLMYSLEGELIDSTSFHQFTSEQGTSITTFGNNVYVTGESHDEPNPFLITQRYLIDEISGIVKNEKEAPLFNFFPNPSHQFVYIQTNLPQNTPVNLHFHNAIGQKLKTQTLQKGQSEYKISLSDIHPGIYYFSFEVEGKVIQSGKFIKT